MDRGCWRWFTVTDWCVFSLSQKSTSVCVCVHPRNSSSASSFMVFQWTTRASRVIASDTKKNNGELMVGLSDQIENLKTSSHIQDPRNDSWWWLSFSVFIFQLFLTVNFHRVWNYVQSRHVILPNSGVVAFWIVSIIVRLIWFLYTYVCRKDIFWNR